ncbi:CHAT domain-containing protein [Geodermatophilus sp. DSM 44513]|uniref:CHAT domain-containing protein n=1 Tax=Geodermatophilus sp. DSM 44513 TaxID=1528104 RepID=UPI00127E143B|nr:CHAT domain-containing protein [Geodermatophilus sp. DSM 44513]WNV76023.1 CHAT domain-containing protein [Geodermatophilus sp. DSM 44513]
MDDEEVTGLLEEAEALVHQDPAAARALALDASGRTSSAALLARADYLTAQVHAIEGDLQTALHLVARARDTYRLAGADLDALRTELGMMHVLNEQGRHDDAIARGVAVLEVLDLHPEVAGTPEQAWGLRGSVHDNISICHTFAGRHLQALEQSRAAETAFRRAGMPEELAAVRQNSGEQLLDLGRVHEAIDVLREAAQDFRETGQVLLEARCLVDTARASARVGRWREALEAFDGARRLLERLDVRADLDQLLLSSAETWLGLGLDSEALVAYREAEASLRRSGQTPYLARVLTGVGVALARDGRLSDAEEALAEAAALHRGRGNVPLLAEVLVETAGVHARRGDRERATALVDEAVRLLSGQEWTSQLVGAHLRGADLAMTAPHDLVRARRHLLAAARLAEPLALPPLQYQVDAGLGRLLRLRGDVLGARAALRAATRVVEDLRATLPTEAMRVSFLRDAAAPYADLVALEMAAGDPVAALAAAERSKSRALVDLLARAHRRGDAGDHLDRVSALHEELMATYTELLHEDPELAPDARARRRAALRTRATQTEAALRAERLRAPVTEADPVGATADPRQLAARLPADLAVVCYHVLDAGRVAAFVVTRDGVTATEDVTDLDRVRPLLRQLDAQWQRTRIGGAFGSRHTARLAAGARRVLADLYEELVAPLGELPDVARLVVVAHGPLHEVPFHALHDGDGWLLERHAVTVAPSLTVLLATLDLPRAHGPALVLAVPDAAATQVTAEAERVARALPGARLRVGEQAGVGTLCGEAPGSAVVHVACHGLFRPENPVFSALRLADGWLTAAQLLEVDLTGSLVTLSACETGRTRAEGAGDEVVGLARAALGAGAAAVIVSLWLVNDAAAAELMARVYELHSHGAPPAEALHRAQCEAALRGDHPYYWAPFVLVGSP